MNAPGEGRRPAAGGGYWAESPGSAIRTGSVEVPVPGTDRRLELRSASHTFSKTRLDPGTALLTRCVVRDLEEAGSRPLRILDLGAGYGPLGLALAARYPDAQVDLVEINGRAAALAEANARALDLSRVTVFAQDAGRFAVGPDGYDLVVTNPPIRAGRAVYAPWLLEAGRFLPGRSAQSGATVGRFYLVARTSQGARTLEGLLRQALPDACTVARESGYRVIRGTRASR